MTGLSPETPVIRISSRHAAGAGVALSMLFFYFLLPPLLNSADVRRLAGRLPFDFNALTILLNPLLMLLTARLIAAALNPEAPPKLRLLRLSRRDLGQLTGIGFATLLLLGVLSAVWGLLLQFLNIPCPPPPAQLALLNSPPETAIALALSATLLAPAVEEILFRQWLYESLAPRCGIAAATLLGSAFFAVLHGTLRQLLPLLVLGMIFQFACLWKKSLLASIYLHFLNNLISVSMLLLLRFRVFAPDSFGLQ